MKKLMLLSMTFLASCTAVGQANQCHDNEIKTAKVIGMTEAMLAVCPQVVNTVYAAQVEAAKAKAAKATTSEKK